MAPATPVPEVDGTGQILLHAPGQIIAPAVFPVVIHLITRGQCFLFQVLF